MASTERKIALSTGGGPEVLADRLRYDLACPHAQIFLARQ